MAEGDPGHPPVYPASVFPEDPSPFRHLVASPEALYWSTRRCWKGVGRKYSAQAYRLNILNNTLDLAEDLADGSYKEGPVRDVHITYPKPRLAKSITFRDRTFQRSLNDNVLYPAMTRSFIYANFACQKGKGTEAALQYMKRMLHNAYLQWRTNRFQIFSMDAKGYYDSLVHQVAESNLAQRVDPESARYAIRTLRHQYKGDKGYNPGSQMVQIAGVSYLDGPLDHFVKEQLRRKFFLRYMDDAHLLGAPDENMTTIRNALAEECHKVGVTLHPDKTRVRLAKDGVVFLGFLFRVTDTGKVLMLRDPKRVKEIKRRLRRLAKVVREGHADLADLETSFECVMACVKKGNSRRLVRNLNDFYQQLKGGLEHARTNYT